MMASKTPHQNVTFDLPTKDGDRTGHGYLALPASGKGPGVIVIQEWWGLVDHIKDVCDRLADLGFVALAPDLYGGWIAHDGDEAGERTGVLLLVVRRTEAGAWEAVAGQNTDSVPEAQTHLADDDGLAAVHYHPSAWIDPDDDPDGPEAC